MFGYGVLYPLKDSMGFAFLSLSVPRSIFFSIHLTQDDIIVFDQLKFNGNLSQQYVNFLEWFQMESQEVVIFQKNTSNIVQN